ncbi:MAG: hypothetical protein KF830_12460 [Planctomycetes bacterium]|nr:hypothetical protein [Planctomycetota bacterium]
MQAGQRQVDEVAGRGADGAQSGVIVLQFAALRPTEQLARGAGAVRRRAGQDLAEDRTETEHVATAVDASEFAARLLGRHVGRRARDPGRRGRIASGAVGVELQRDPPIHDLHLAERAHHDVVRLQIAVRRCGSRVRS